MAKRIQAAGTPLDGEVVELLRRLVTDGAEFAHIVGYTVQRRVDDVHRVTIEFIADDRFDARPDEDAKLATERRTARLLGRDDTFGRHYAEVDARPDEG